MAGTDRCANRVSGGREGWGGKKEEKQGNEERREGDEVVDDRA